MKSITDDTYYEIDTKEFFFSPYAIWSEENFQKREKKYWKSKSSKKYYNTMKDSILFRIELHGVMFEPITTEILDKIRFLIFASPFEEGAICKKLRVFFNADKQQIQIDWKFNGNSYEVFVQDTSQTDY